MKLMKSLKTQQADFIAHENHALLLVVTISSLVIHGKILNGF